MPATSSGSRIQSKTDIERINDYIIESNPEGVKKLLLLNGYNRVTTIRDMQIALLELVKNDSGAISQLLSEHPDYELIVADYLEKNPAGEPKKKAKKKDKVQGTYSTHGAYTDVSRSFGRSSIPVITLDFNIMVQLLMFLVCVWLALKIFKKDQ